MVRVVTEALFILSLQVKDRTLSGGYYGSHVMQYGNVGLSKDSLFLYLGTDPANDNLTFVDENSLRASSTAVNQRDADLVHFWHKVSCLFKIHYFGYELIA